MFISTIALLPLVSGSAKPGPDAYNAAQVLQYSNTDNYPSAHKICDKGLGWFIVAGQVIRHTSDSLKVLAQGKWSTYERIAATERIQEKFPHHTLQNPAGFYVSTYELARQGYFESTIAHIGRTIRGVIVAANCGDNPSAPIDARYIKAAKVFHDAVPKLGTCINSIALSGVGIVDTHQMRWNLGRNAVVSKCALALNEFIRASVTDYSTEKRDLIHGSLDAFWAITRVVDAALTLDYSPSHKSISSQLFDTRNRVLERLGKAVATITLHFKSSGGEALQITRIVSRVLEVSMYVLKILNWVVLGKGDIHIEDYKFGTAQNGECAHPIESVTAVEPQRHDRTASGSNRKSGHRAAVLQESTL